VIGKSCDVTAEMNWEESGEKAQVEVSVPVKTLDSGNPLRDGDIPEILKADLTPNIRFVSEWLEKSAWDKMMEGQLPEVSGNLEVAGGIFPVKFALSFSKQAGFLLVEGQLKTTFSALNVDVPLVVGGLIADPQDELELQLHLRLDKIAGAEKIKNNK
jgi:polyisoprenoid-binding protein YceI